MLFRSAVSVGLLTSSDATRIHSQEVLSANPQKEKVCPQTTSESNCPHDLHFCRSDGGCYEATRAKYCEAVLCPLPKAGGSRFEEEVIDVSTECPKDPPCAGGSLYCPNDKGCYKPGQDKQCGVSLCPGKKTGTPSTPSTPSTPIAPTPKPSAPSSTSAPSTPSAPSAPPYVVPSDSSILAPVDTNLPPAGVFPSHSGHYMPPVHVESPDINTPQTNKFWTNWISGKPNDGQKPIYSMPYALQFSDSDDGWKCHYYASGQDNDWCKSHPIIGNDEHNFFGPDGTCGHCHCCRRVKVVIAEVLISHREPTVKYNSDTSDRKGRIAYYISRFVPSYSMGMVEKTSPKHFNLIKEDLTGVRVVIPGQVLHGQTIEFPVYRGMPYVTAKYQGATPRIASPQGIIRSVTKVKKGVFEFKNDEGHPDKLWECHYYDKGQDDDWCKEGHIENGGEFGFFGNAKIRPCGVCDCCRRPSGAGEKEYGTIYRAFVMDKDGNFLDGDFTNSSVGFKFSNPLDGWVRMAHIVDAKDAVAYEKYATSILESMTVDIKNENEFQYNFKTSGKGEHLHFAWYHQKLLLQSPTIVPESQLTHIKAPTKGKMIPITGKQWTLKIDTKPALKLDLLPEIQPTGGLKSEVETQLRVDITSIQACLEKGSMSTLECEGPRTWIFTSGFYTNGKGLQKLGTLCVLSQRMFGDSDKGTVACGELLKRAFKCHSDPSASCGGVPKAYYDANWGGIASRQGFENHQCGLADFGNACYNDHHYHYGYFIHAGAMLLQVMPGMRNDNDFVAYINSMIRDIANPSLQDKYFPQFRAFDWYDLHSWSHGVTPSSDGKDEESTSEDMNAYFGIQQWAKRVGHKSLEKIGAMQLALLAHSASNLFLMKDDNAVHPPDYIRNRVTGIFFEAKVHYGTFFGADEVYIHGIQMLPLSPALRLARSKEFCMLEYKDIISKKPLPIPGKSEWSSLIITGNVALHDAQKAWDQLKQCKDLDRGLSRSWAMYWIASLAAEQR